MALFYTELFVEFIRKQKQLSSTTVSAYRRDLDAFLSYLDERGITCAKEVQESDLSLYMLRMKHSGKSPATVSRAVATLRNYFGFLQNSGYLGERGNPAFRLAPPRVERKEPDLLSLEDIERLLSCPDPSTLKGARDAAILELFYGVGLKVTELLSLNRDDVHLDLGFIRCSSESEKNGSHSGGGSRFLPLGKYSREALTRYLDGLKSHSDVKDSAAGDNALPLFVSAAGHRLTRQGVWKMIKTYSAAAGIEKEVTPHNLRHAFAVHLLQNGAEVRSVQELLGLGDNSRLHMHHFQNHAKKSLKEVMDRSHPRG